MTVGGLNEVQVFRTSDFEKVATIPVGKLPHGLWPSGDGTGANFHNNVSPFVTPQPGAMFVLLKDLSTATPLEDRKPALTMQVTRFHVHPGHEAQFESAMAVARAKLASIRLAQAHTWYRIVVGGTHTEYLLMVSRANLASYDDFRADPDRLLAGNKALHDFADAVESATSET